MCIDYLLSLNRVSEARYERADVIDYWSHLVIENEERTGRTDIYGDGDVDVDMDVDMDVDVIGYLSRLIREEEGRDGDVSVNGNGSGNEQSCVIDYLSI